MQKARKSLMFLIMATSTISMHDFWSFDRVKGKLVNVHVQFSKTEQFSESYMAILHLLHWRLQSLMGILVQDKRLYKKITINTNNDTKTTNLEEIFQSPVVV